MKHFIAGSVLLLLGCSHESSLLGEMKPENAVADAQKHFNEMGFSQIMLEHGTQIFSGEKVLPQDFIICASSGADLNLVIKKVELLADVALKEYVTTYNTEMVRLNGTQRKCKQS